MLTNVIKAAAASALTLAVFYVFGAFCAWSWDAGTWAPEGRALLGVFGLFAAFITCLSTFNRAY